MQYYFTRSSVIKQENLRLSILSASQHRNNETRMVLCDLSCYHYHIHSLTRRLPKSRRLNSLGLIIQLYVDIAIDVLFALA